MHLPFCITTLNLWIVGIAFALGVVNAVASSRLAPAIAALFVRRGHRPTARALPRPR